MDSLDQILNRNSAILSALSQMESYGWCFLPASADFAACCSATFATQWNLKLLRLPAASMHEVPAVMIERAMYDLGFELRMFALSEDRAPGESTPTLPFVRSDGLNLEARVFRISAQDGSSFGDLIHFSERTESRLIEAILQQVTRAKQRLEVLSPREREILMMVYRGRTNKAIAQVARISEKTVEKHRARVMQKLNLSSTAALYHLVVRAMLLSDSDEQDTAEEAARNPPSQQNMPTPHLFRKSNHMPQR